MSHTDTVQAIPKIGEVVWVVWSGSGASSWRVSRLRGSFGEVRGCWGYSLGLLEGYVFARHFSYRILQRPPPPNSCQVVCQTVFTFFRHYSQEEGLGISFFVVCIGGQRFGLRPAVHLPLPAEPALHRLFLGLCTDPCPNAKSWGPKPALPELVGRGRLFGFGRFSPSTFGEKTAFDTF